MEWQKLPERCKTWMRRSSGGNGGRCSSGVICGSHAKRFSFQKRENEGEETKVTLCTGDDEAASQPAHQQPHLKHKCGGAVEGTQENLGLQRHRLVVLGDNHPVCIERRRRTQ